MTHGLIFGAGCNQRTPILDTAVVTTAPSAFIPAVPLPPDNVSRLALNPPGNMGGGVGTGTVYLDVPARGSGRVVSLRSSDESIVTLPSQIVVGEGALSADFSFTTRAVQRDVNVTITASSGERTISEYVAVWTATTSFFAYTADPGAVRGPLVRRASSDAGDQLAGGCNFDGGGLFSSADARGSESIRVFLSGPRGVRIGPGVYNDAVNTGGAPGNYLNLDTILCQSTGRVELHEVSVLANGTATRLWFSFEQRCLDRPAAVRGIFRLIGPGPTTPLQCARGLRPGV
jgi:hypothetical protein